MSHELLQKVQKQILDECQQILNRADHDANNGFVYRASILKDTARRIQKVAEKAVTDAMQESQS